MNASNDVYEILRFSGNRVTQSRKKIIVYLEKVAQPQSIQMIVSALAVDEVSVYRTIALFKELEIVEEIIIADGSRLYARAHGHHHHVVCTVCSRIAHIPCRYESLTAYPGTLSPIGFQSIAAHTVTYYGVCTTCTA